MLTHTLGFPRIGMNRELKKTVESYWRGEISDAKLAAETRAIRHANWQIQKGCGIDLIPVGDFSLYDHILDMTCALGAIPPRFGLHSRPANLKTYFRMARGDYGTCGAAPLEMTKWFDTNYHYLVPEFRMDESFPATAQSLIEQLREASELGIYAKAVLPGPMTYLSLGKCTQTGFDRWKLLDSLTRAYCVIIEECAKLCAWIQFDEPILAADISCEVKKRFEPVYHHISEAAGNTRIMVATYFGDIRHNADVIAGLPMDCIHFDLVRAPGQAVDISAILPNSMLVSLGVVDGRNVWKTDMESTLVAVNRCIDAFGTDRLMIAPSCSLLHVPVDLDAETALPDGLRNHMAFAVQKCREVRAIADTVKRPETIESGTTDLRTVHGDVRGNDPSVHERMESLSESMYHRSSAYTTRRIAQKEKLNLPAYPTTTIGSFPQTSEIRAARKMYATGEIAREDYERRMRDYIAACIRKQEEIGLDVLVHGEPERNDMVEYFGELLNGFLITRNGWVQSYGTRCVKPPVIYGDVSRRDPMTVRWIVHAQSLTKKPVKGMLTGPVTILSWSFVRNDQPRSETCRQLALAIRDEACDLENAGISIIQIDEPAFREGAPVRKKDRPEYYRWASECFRLASSGVRDNTQIHTHMCYSEFNEIIEAIASLDADVISVEAARSGMELLNAFRDYEYPNEIGPGVYDIHSPRIPSADEMVKLLKKAAARISLDRLWVNPDCGLKTRQWSEVEPALRNMVEAARTACEI